MPLPPRPSANAAASRVLLRDSVYDTLQAAILDGTLKPGEELRVDDLITRLGVSRTPIRDALLRLADVGLVETKANSYTRVAAIDFDQIAQGLEVLAVFYEHLARTQAPVTDDHLLTQLNDLAQAIAQGGANNDRSLLTVVINSYFLVLAEAAGNPVLRDTMTNGIPLLRRSLVPRSELRDLGIIADYMGQIHHAITDGDGDRAGDTVHDLFAPTRENFVNNIRSK